MANHGTQEKELKARRPVWRDLGESLALYWGAHGGWRDFWRSAYLQIALVLTAICFPAWTAEGWWADPISILPSLLGFSLGGYALLLAFGDEDFRVMLAGRTQRDRAAGKFSPYMRLNATFVHFAIAQLIALSSAMLAKATQVSAAPLMVLPWMRGLYWSLACQRTLHVLRLVASALGYLTFWYAIVLVVAAALAIFRIATWYDDSQSEEEPEPQASEMLPPAAASKALPPPKEAVEGPRASIVTPAVR